jgi:hypothetical protein
MPSVDTTYSQWTSTVTLYWCDFVESLRDFLVTKVQSVSKRLYMYAILTPSAPAIIAFASKVRTGQR